MVQFYLVLWSGPGSEACFTPAKKSKFLEQKGRRERALNLTFVVCWWLHTSRANPDDITMTSFRARHDITHVTVFYGWVMSKLNRGITIKDKHFWGWAGAPCMEARIHLPQVRLWPDPLLPVFPSLSLPLSDYQLSYHKGLGRQKTYLKNKKFFILNNIKILLIYNGPQSVLFIDFQPRLLWSNKTRDIL